jgi:hypothetical protein
MKGVFLRKFSTEGNLFALLSEVQEERGSTSMALKGEYVIE